MKVHFSERFQDEWLALAKPLQKKCLVMVKELHDWSLDDLGRAFKNKNPWRIHRLKASSMTSLSLDMNYRVLSKIRSDNIWCLRVVPHKVADRPHVNRNDSQDTFVELSGVQLKPSELYEALQVFGLSGSDVECFRECSTEDDLLDAAAKVSTETSDFALNLYGSSGLAIPKARYRSFHRDQTFDDAILNTDSSDWELYLHPSQEFVVELPTSSRAAVVGSAGTGKTICAVRRTAHLAFEGITVGYVCPNDFALEVSKKQLSSINCDESYYLVAKQPDELLQLAEAVDHMIIDEAQEIPSTWLSSLGAKMPNAVGLTVLYDLNQLGGNIPRKDNRRYRRRITDWKNMIRGIPRMQEFVLSVNYRNSREIANYYLDVLSESLPAKPFAPAPVFEAGEVHLEQIRHRDLQGRLASLLRGLLKNYEPREIGIVTLETNPEDLLQNLQDGQLRVTSELAESGIVVTNASRIRGHERKVVIVITRGTDAMQRSIGSAVNAYIAMSRATVQLFIVSLDA